MKYFLELNNTNNAILAVNNLVVVDAYEVIKKKRLKIHDDIAIVNFSNNLISALTEPPALAIVLPAFEISKQVALIIFKQIKNKTFVSSTKIIKIDLIERKPTEKIFSFLMHKFLENYILIQKDERTMNICLTQC